MQEDRRLVQGRHRDCSSLIRAIRVIRGSPPAFLSCRVRRPSHTVPVALHAAAGMRYHFRWPGRRPGHPSVPREDLAMRSLRSCGLLVLMGLCALPAGGDTSRPPVKDKSTRDKSFKKADKSDKASPGKVKEYPDLGDLHAEVTVLRVLHAFDAGTE